jgi:hypothetical protein
MLHSTCVNSLGLVLDIVGAVLLWLYGIPEPISRTGAQYLITGMTDEKTKQKAKRFHTLSKLGLGLLIVGFVLQLASNLLK